MPSKKASAKKAPRPPSPSGRGCGPAPAAQPKVQDDQAERPPLHKTSDNNISFSDDEGHDTIKVGELKEPEEVDTEVSEEDKVSDDALFACCCSDLNIPQQGLGMMTPGQLGDLKLLFKKLDSCPKACLPLAAYIALPVPNPTSPKAQPGIDLQRRLDKPKENSKTIDMGKFAYLAEQLKGEALTQELTIAFNQCPDFDITDVANFRRVRLPRTMELLLKL